MKPIAWRHVHWFYIGMTVLILSILIYAYCMALIEETSTTGTINTNEWYTVSYDTSSDSINIDTENETIEDVSNIKYYPNGTAEYTVEDGKEGYYAIFILLMVLSIIIMFVVFTIFVMVDDRLKARYFIGKMGRSRFRKWVSYFLDDYMDNIKTRKKKKVFIKELMEALSPECDECLTNVLHSYESKYRDSNAWDKVEGYYYGSHISKEDAFKIMFSVVSDYNDGHNLGVKL